MEKGEIEGYRYGMPLQPLSQRFLDLPHEEVNIIRQ